MLRQLYCLLIAAFFSGAAFAQNNFAINTGGGNTFANDINGRPLYLKTEYQAEGSPYYYDYYCFAEVTDTSGKIYLNARIKFNLMEKQLIYTLDDGTEMLVETPIRRIKFYNFIENGVSHDPVTLESFNGPINAPGAQVFEVLEDGEAKLLNQLTVTYTDEKPYGSATITRRFKKNEALYAAIGKSAPRKIEKNKADVAALFGKKQSLVLAYMDEKKLKCKSARDLAAVFGYYNSL